MSQKNFYPSPAMRELVARLSDAECPVHSDIILHEWHFNIRTIAAANYHGLIRWVGETYPRIREEGYEPGSQT